MTFVTFVFNNELSASYTSPGELLVFGGRGKPHHREVFSSNSHFLNRKDVRD